MRSDEWRDERIRGSIYKSIEVWIAWGYLEWRSEKEKGNAIEWRGSQMRDAGCFWGWAENYSLRSTSS